MYTKSLIQQTIEKNNRLMSMKEGLNNLMDKYLIEDSIFLYNNEVKIVSNGYFVVNEEYNNLDDALKNFNPDNDVIRIMENKEFLIGKIYNKLSDCPENEKILSINNI